MRDERERETCVGVCVCERESERERERERETQISGLAYSMTTAFRQIDTNKDGLVDKAREGERQGERDGRTDGRREFSDSRETNHPHSSSGPAVHVARGPCGPMWTGVWRDLRGRPCAGSFQCDFPGRAR